MHRLIPHFVMAWMAFPGRYALWRMGITYDESRCHNVTDRILLTFDDDGTPDNIRGILKVLNEHKVRAVFFLMGKWAKQNPELIKEIQAGGHWIGNHSYTHQHLIKLDDQAVEAEIGQGLRTELMRPPYGEFNRRVRKVAEKLGFKIAVWTVDSLDWKGIGVEEIQDNVLPNLHPGACVLMHLNTPHTLEALPGLIAGIRERGFELCHDGSEIRLK